MKDITKIVIASVCWLTCVSLPVAFWAAIWNFAMDKIPVIEASARVAVTIACIVFGGLMTVWAGFFAVALIGSVLLVSLK